MSTFCPLCGSAVDDGETCSCRSQGIQPVILEGLIQEQTTDFGGADVVSAKPAENVSQPSMAEKNVQTEEKIEIISDLAQNKTETIQVDVQPRSVQPQFQPIESQPASTKPTQIQPIQSQPVPEEPLSPVQSQPAQQQTQSVQPQAAPARGADIAPKPSVGVDIELFAPRKQRPPTPDMSFGANPMMKLDLGLDDEPVRPAGQAASAGMNIGGGASRSQQTSGTGVNIGGRTPGPQQTSGVGVDIGGRAPGPQQTSGVGVNIGGRAPGPQQTSSVGVDIGGRAPGSQQSSSVGVDIGGRAPGSQQTSGAGVNIGGRAPGFQQMSGVGVDIGGRASQPQAASQRSKQDVLRDKYEQQDRMIMEKAGLLPREEEKLPEPEEMYPVEKYTAGEFFEDLKYDPVDAIENFVENGSILFAILFILIQAAAAGMYAGVFAIRYGENATVSGDQFMLAFVTTAIFILFGNIILAFVEMKMLEGSSSEAYIQTLLAVISMYALAGAPCLLLAAVIALLSPLASVPFAAASWAMAIFVKGIAFGGLRDLDSNRVAVPVLASCGIQGVIILLIGFVVKILMG